MSPQFSQPLQAIAQIGEDIRSIKGQIEGLQRAVSDQQKRLDTIWVAYWGRGENDGLLVRMEAMRSTEESIQWMLPLLRGEGDRGGLLTKVELLHDEVSDLTRDFERARARLQTEFSEVRSQLAANGKEETWQDAIDFLKLHPRVSVAIAIVGAVTAMVEPALIKSLLSLFFGG